MEVKTGFLGVNVPQKMVQQIKELAMRSQLDEIPGKSWKTATDFVVEAINAHLTANKSHLRTHPMEDAGGKEEGS